MKQRFRQHELKHSVAEKFETLIALRAGLVLRERRVGDRAFEEGRVAERVGEARGEFCQRLAHELALA